jgi:hypothetical protein
MRQVKREEVGCAGTGKMAEFGQAGKNLRSDWAALALLPQASSGVGVR